ncbi:MAG TPA: pyruvate, water dikinase regulatory protein, partial [Caldilineaceae bacterium]|nr:pyruvate, water dikinase regulatory protein [Caldilineaceae bacterium]
QRQPPSAPIFIVSGGVGSSGEQVVRTVLAQFDTANTPIVIEPYIHRPEQIQAVVEQVANSGGLLVHTLVEDDLRQQLVALAAAKNIAAVDLFGPLLLHLGQMLDRSPAGQPGLYRQLNQSYFKRTEAIEFAVAHDDGKRVYELSLADIVLLGVSRVGKTPLSIYLSMLGWKVANVALAPPIAPPAELFQVDWRRVIGLTIAPVQLLVYRRSRQQQLGIQGGSYTEHEAVRDELRAANHLFASHGFAIIDVTDKPIETSGEEVVMTLTRQLQQPQ